MKRQIIRIDEEKCNGCGLCVPNCHEGALQIIDGKARLISDLFCDGLGACIGHCPEGAIEIIEREAEPYDERKVMETIVPKGRNTILAHLDHLRVHNEQTFLAEAIRYLKENNIDMSPSVPGEKITGEQENGHSNACGCPGSISKDFRQTRPVVEHPAPVAIKETIPAPSELKQWPVQLHLLNPQASYFRDADVLLAADCAAFSMGNFHSAFMKGKSIAIACPKLDSNKESYVQKLTSMIKDSQIRSLTVVMMEVPCCGGLMQMAKVAMENSGKVIPMKRAVLSLRGEVLHEEHL